MRINVFNVKDGRTALSVPSLLLVSVAVPAVLVGAVELFWFFFTGGVSPLVGGFALIASIMTLIRLIGESFARTQRSVESGLHQG